MNDRMNSTDHSLNRPLSLANSAGCLPVAPETLALPPKS